MVNEIGQHKEEAGGWMLGQRQDWFKGVTDGDSEQTRGLLAGVILRKQEGHARIPGLLQ